MCRIDVALKIRIHTFIFRKKQKTLLLHALKENEKKNITKKDVDDHHNYGVSLILLPNAPKHIN